MTIAGHDVANKINRLTDLLLQQVVPLFMLPEGRRPILAGTGFLVSVRTSNYLVSAAHVLDEIPKPHSLYYYIKPKTYRKVTGTLLRTKLPPNGQREEDRIDIGVVRLAGPGLPPYPEVEKYPMPVSALMANAQPRTGKQYLFAGFSESKSRANPYKREILSEPAGFIGPSASLDKYTRLGVLTNTHIVVDFDAV